MLMKLLNYLGRYKNIMETDYRLTIYCKEFSNIQENKAKLEDEIKKEKGEVDIYKIIRKKGTDYNRKFLEIYNCKCAYCGSSNKILDYTTDYEVDHIVNKASFELESEANIISNLVSSCYFCNRGKSKYYLDAELAETLNPDNENITKVFERDSLYNIKIREEYKDDERIKQFYEKLRLGNEFRRLDFLLMNVIEFLGTIKEEELKAKFLQIIFILEQSSKKYYRMSKEKVNV